MMSFSQSAQSSVITFNGTAVVGHPTYAGGTTHTEAGYTVAISGDTYFIDNNDTSNFPGIGSFDDDVLEFNELTGESITITRDGGGLFDLSSVVTGNLGRGSYDDGNFIFTGTFGVGGTISQTVLGLATTNLITFLGFTGLASVTVTTSDGLFPVMDDITLFASTTPIPAAFPLFASGLGFLGLFGWRRKRKKAALAA